MRFNEPLFILLFALKDSIHVRAERTSHCCRFVTMARDFHKLNLGGLSERHSLDRREVLFV